MLEEIIRKRHRDKAVEMLFPKLFEQEQRKKEWEKQIQEMPNAKTLMNYASENTQRGS
ncbi:MAG: hypothetical protein NXH96_02645 [Alteromonadaceae bacterium]|nr:hypothetical protein [Alteromonadaceae bacterium]